MTEASDIAEAPDLVHARLDSYAQQMRTARKALVRHQELRDRLDREWIAMLARHAARRQAIAQSRLGDLRLFFEEIKLDLDVLKHALRRFIVDYDHRRRAVRN